jgi:hypothetical protein
MVGRIREIVFEDGIDVDGVATEAASEDYVDNIISTQGALLIDPHGWTEYDNTYMTRGWTSNTFSLTQVGASTPYYHKGILKLLSGNKSIGITPTAGAHYIGLNCTTEVLEDLGSDLPTAQILSTHIIVEFCHCNGSAVTYKANERHTTKFLKRDWIFKHYYLSTQYRSGLTTSITSIDGNGSDISHAQFSVIAGVISDEDIDLTTNALLAATAKSMWFYNGTYWANTPQSSGAGVLPAGTGRAAYNNIASGLVECTDNYHVLTHLFATNSGDVIGIVGNTQYQLARDARIAASSEIATLLNNGLPFPEFRAIATFINKTKDTYSNSVKTLIISVDTGVPYIDWRKTALNPVAGSNAATHNNLSGLQGGQPGEYYHTTAAQNANTVNNVFPSGAPTNSTNKILLPTNTTAGWAGLTPTESLIGWDSTKKKPVVANGSAVNPIGGGLTVSILDAPATSGVNLEIGKHYVVINLSADTVLNLPQLVAEATLEVSVVNMTPAETYRVTLAAYAGDEVSYDGIHTHTSAKLVYANSWAKFAANLTTFWQVDDASSPLNGTFSGALTVTDVLTANSGIILDDAVGQTNLNYHRVDAARLATAYWDFDTVNTGNIAGSIVRIGPLVNITFSDIYNGQNAGTPVSVASSVNLEAWARPAKDMQFPCIVVSNNASSTGTIQIGSTGNINLYFSTVLNTAWPAAANSGMLGTSVSYYTNA